MTDNPTCPVGEGDHVIEHEQLGYREGRVPHYGGAFDPRAYPCAVPGVSLTDYSLNASQKGWGGPCTQAHTVIALTNGVQLTVASRIARLVTLIMNANLADGYVYRQADTGAYNCRYISGTTVWSNHAWALAIDENWQTNPMRSPLTTDKPVWERQRWNRYGFAWGGDYLPPTNPDAMHFEFMGTPDEADAATALAESELANYTPGPAPAPVDTQVQTDQANLNDTGFPCQVTGVWDDQSVSACKAFQFAARITVDGVCGPETRSMLTKVPSWHSGGNIADDSGGYPASQWQRKLKDHGWSITVDNIWGTHSRSILGQFQADKGITVDSNRGPQSWTCLYCTVN